MPVAIAFAVVNSLLLLWMLGLTRRARRTLPPGAPVPVHGGLGGWDKWWPKERALFGWLFAGTVAWLATVGAMIAVVADAAERSNGGLAALPAALVLPMAILLISEYLAVKAAARVASDPGTFA